MDKEKLEVGVELEAGDCVNDLYEEIERLKQQAYMCSCAVQLLGNEFKAMSEKYVALSLSYDAQIKEVCDSVDAKYRDVCSCFNAVFEGKTDEEISDTESRKNFREEMSAENIKNYKKAWKKRHVREYEDAVRETGDFEDVMRDE